MRTHKPFRIKRYNEDKKLFVVATIAPNGKEMSITKPYKRRRSCYAMVTSAVNMILERRPFHMEPVNLANFVEDQS